MMTENQTINILIADDHQLVVDGIKSMLATEAHYKVVAEANDGRQAWDMIQASDAGQYQLLVTDISMPLLSGVELCRMVKQKYPEIKVLILSMYNNVSVVKEAIAAEADGYILKNTGKAEFLTALYRISDGGTYFTQDILPIIYNQYQKEKKQEEQLATLSQREKEILILIVKEHTSEEIAQKLFISKKTVDNHRAHILEKTHCRSTIGLVKYAIKSGIE
jgi:DNA-binding NarL/FixJ family response regulator